jgi:biotin carboxyl carrier protein
LPATGRIAEVLAEDTSEVNYGQPLFRIVAD